MLKELELLRRITDRMLLSGEIRWKLRDILSFKAFGPSTISCFHLVSTARANYHCYRCVAVGKRFQTDSVELEAFYYQIETAQWANQISTAHLPPRPLRPSRCRAACRASSRC